MVAIERPMMRACPSPELASERTARTRTGGPGPMSEPVRPIPPRNYIVSAALLLLVGLVVGLGLSAGLGIQLPSRAARVAALEATISNDAVPPSPFVSVVEKSLPAVVFIDVKKRMTRGSGDSDPQSELFRRFFDEGPQREQRVPSSGSGFIVDRAGHVLTNNHVVANASDITVQLNDRRSFKAKVVGTDPETDVAVIKIEGDNLPVMPLGDSDKIRVGDWAVAMGNPLGMLRGSVTVGIISARGRSSLNIFGGTPSFQDFIQTDASINFGNSGGPLCNIRGEAIGINTAINPSGQGIGFAIPINLAKHVADQLVAHGTVSRAWLGVTLAEMTPELAEGFGLRNADGVIIQSVLKNEPADKAGLRRNDVIVEFDGQPVADMQKFRLKVADTEVGRTVPVVVIREGKRMTVSVKLGPRSTEQVASTQSPTAEGKESLGGLTVRDMTSQERQASGVSNGVVITDVRDGSAADDAGLEPDMVIEEVGGKPATNASAFTRLLQEAKGRGRHAVLLVRVGDDSRFIPLRLAD
jgi:serine protease Do